MILTQILILIPLLGFLLWALFMVLSIIKGAPFIRSSRSKISTILSLAQATSSDCVLDFGSGDASIVLQFAKKGVRADGCEINLLLVLYSRLMIQRWHVGSIAHVYWKNMWQFDTSSYSLITIYGFPTIMADLEKKLLRELSPGARVISNSFQFPNWKPDREENSLFLYTVPSKSF